MVINRSREDILKTGLSGHSMIAPVSAGKRSQPVVAVKTALRCRLSIAPFGVSEKPGDVPKTRLIVAACSADLRHLRAPQLAG